MPLRVKEESHETTCQTGTLPNLFSIRNLDVVHEKRQLSMDLALGYQSRGKGVAMVYRNVEIAEAK